MVSYSLYIHIPFCKHRCAYCDFNTYAGIEDLIPEYIRALGNELEYLSKSAPQPLNVHSIFFGGGTPSLLPIKGIEYIIRVANDSYKLSEAAEITLEANPGTLSRSYILDLKHIGINRLSIGMQSSKPAELEILERQHTYIDVIEAVKWAHQAGINNINLDLLFAIPYQTLEDWKLNLKRAVALEPEHLSLYALILEHGTPMQRWVARGLINSPDPDLDADMYNWTSYYLSSMGYLQYEISNWAREVKGEKINYCAHNLQYWRNKSYLGLGAGAHGYALGSRLKNISSPHSYIKQMRDIRSSENGSVELAFPRTPATARIYIIDKKTEMSETMMMGLRLTQEGVSAKEFESRFGISLGEVFGIEIDRLVSLGLLEWVGEQALSLHLTSRGRILGNQVFMEFV